MFVAGIDSMVRPPIRCRQIRETDTDGIVDLLTSGRRLRTRDRFTRVFERLAQHPTPAGFPKYGYLLENDGVPVGVLLLICSSVLVNGAATIRCNVSGWYVEPAFRSYAAMLVSHALNDKHATYFNVAPAPHTLPILEAQGYVRYCSGWFVSIPAVCPRSIGARVRRVTPDIRPDADLQPCEIELLLAHAQYGCMSLTCSSGNRRHPFIFRLGLKLGRFRWVPYAYLVYCRDVEDFVRFAGPLGRFLAWRGCFLVVVDSNGPIQGLVGKYSADHPKYFKGPNQPRLGDLAYSQRAMFEPQSRRRQDYIGDSGISCG